MTEIIHICQQCRKEIIEKFMVGDNGQYFHSECWHLREEEKMKKLREVNDGAESNGMVNR